MKRFTFFCLLLTIAFSLPLTAQNLKNDPEVKSSIRLLELWLDAQRDYEQIPGLSMSIVHDQEILWSGGFGYSDLDEKTVANSGTIYSICSISKLFTSIAVLQQRDAGKLRLSDPVSDHLSWFTIKNMYPEGPPVTVRGILTHSSGLPRESDFPYWTAPDYLFPEREQIIEKLSSQETLYPGDTYFQYSNLGLTLAGEVAAEVTGTDYDTYIRSNILDPLGLNDTRTFLPEELLKGRLATGYSSKTREGKRNKLKLFHANGIAPAAGYSSTVIDLAKFASWQFRVLDRSEENILSCNTLREMHRVQFLDPGWDTSWGLGFAVWRIKNDTFVGHGGSCPGYRSQLLIHPKSKIATVFMANASGVNARKFTQRAYDIIAPAVKKALNRSEAAEPVNPDLEKYTGTYSEEPWGGETAVIIWDGKLGMVGFPTDNPLSRITELKHIEGDTFRRVREDGELGEEIRFETDASGNVIKVWQHSNFSLKIR